MTRIQLWKARGIPGYLVCQMDEETECYLSDDEHSLLVQSDWDYPSVASAFGFVPCSCGGTDGTVDCPHKNTHEMIQEAQDFLDDCLGAIVEDPGYFS
jgi:hypothetical protein